MLGHRDLLSSLDAIEKAAELVLQFTNADSGCTPRCSYSHRRIVAPSRNGVVIARWGDQREKEVFGLHEPGVFGLGDLRRLPDCFSGFLTAVRWRARSASLSAVHAGVLRRSAGRSRGRQLRSRRGLHQASVRPCAANQTDEVADEGATSRLRSVGKRRIAETQNEPT